MNEYNSRYLFFLQTGPRLPEFYFQLGQILKAWGVQIIPLQLHDFKALEQKERSDIVCFIPDMATYRLVLKFKENYLNYYLNLKQVRLYEISSFRPGEQYQRHFRTGHYIHFPMPIEIEAIAHRIIQDQERSAEKSQRWPGGRRSKLPAV